jgi:6-phosphogluconolactonase (cycloisomerase 2 family)
VVSDFDSQVTFFRRDTDTGKLSSPIHASAPAGARSLALSPGGGRAYLASAGLFGDFGFLTVYERDATTGELSFVEEKRDDQGGVDGLEGANWVVVSPDGNHVYVAAQLDGAVTIFRVNE